MRALMYSSDADAYEYALACMVELELAERRKALEAKRGEAWAGAREYFGELYGRFLLPEDIERIRNSMNRARGRRVAAGKKTIEPDPEMEQLEESFRERLVTRLRETCKKTEEELPKGMLPGVIGVIAAGMHVCTSKKERKARDLKRVTDAAKAAEEEKDSEEDDSKPPAKKQLRGVKRGFQETKKDSDTDDEGAGMGDAMDE